MLRCQLSRRLGAGCDPLQHGDQLLPVGGSPSPGQELHGISLQGSQFSANVPGLRVFDYAPSSDLASRPYEEDVDPRNSASDHRDGYVLQATPFIPRCFAIVKRAGLN